MISLTKQEWFSNAWERAKNPVKSIRGPGACTYVRSFEGGCFIGCSDLQDVLKSEGRYAEHLVALNLIEVKDAISTSSAFFLQELQNIHDTIDPNQWNTALREFAKIWEVTIPE